MEKIVDVFDVRLKYSSACFGELINKEDAFMLYKIKEQSKHEDLSMCIIEFFNVFEELLKKENLKLCRF